MSDLDAARREAPIPLTPLRGGRDLPHNLEAEQAVLGAMLLDENAFDLVAPILKAEDFYVAAHQHTFGVCVELVLEKKALDPVLVSQRLDAKGLLGHAVPHELPFVLARGLGTAGNVVHYANVVLDLARLRRMMLVAQGILTRGYEAAANVQEFLDGSTQQVFGASQGVNVETLKKIEDPMIRAIEQIQAVQTRVQEGKSPITGVPTGIGALDHKLLGLQPGALVVLAARPSVGKTAFALNIGSYAATRAEKTVAIFSLEMPSEQLSTRILAAEAKLDWRRMSQGQLQRNDWDKIMHHADRISRAKIWLDDNFVLTPVELRAKCRKVRREQGALDLVIVDYLQLMHSPGANSREQEIATISRSLKQIAKELECPVLALSQLNRGVEKRKGEPPMLSDLRESGAIEQDADVVMFLHRPGDPEQEGGSMQPQGDVQDIELHIAKQRQGPTGVVELVFFKSHTYFAERQKSA
jgi:replicative DNA helicase